MRARCTVAAAAVLAVTTTLCPAQARPARHRHAVQPQAAAAEILIRLARSAAPADLPALALRYRLVALEQHTFMLTGITIYRCRVAGRRSIKTVVRALERDGAVVAAAPNRLFAVKKRHS